MALLNTGIRPIQKGDDLRLRRPRTINPDINVMDNPFFRARYYNTRDYVGTYFERQEKKSKKQEEYRRKQEDYQKRQAEYNKQLEKTSSVRFDYNNPNEVNSFGDIIVNAFSPGNKKKKKNKDNLAYQLYDLTNVPEILEILKESVDLIRRGTIKPLLKGDFTSVGLNALVNIGETMDVPGNIVKGALFEGAEGAKKAFNWDGKGRYNYDFDTGNIALDLGCEILVDPMNWISFGGPAIAKMTAKGFTKEVTSEVAEKITKEVSVDFTEKANKKIAQRAIRAYTKGDYDTLTDATNAIIKNFSKDRKFKTYFNGKLTKKDVLQVMNNMQDAVLEVNSNRILDSIRKLTIPQEAYESFMLKGALSGTGIYPAYKALKYANGTVKDLIHQKQYKSWEVALKDMTKADGTFDVFKYEDIIKVDEKYKNMLDTVKNYTDLDDPTNKGILETAFSNSVNHDLQVIDDLLLKNDKSILDFDNALREYLGLGKTERTALEEYMSQLNKINKATDGAFDDVEKILIDIKEEVDFKIKAINDEMEFKLKKAELDSIEHMHTQTVNILDGNTFKQVNDKIIKKYDKLMDTMTPIQFYKAVNEDIIIKEISSEFANIYNPVFKQLNKVLALGDEFINIKTVAKESLNRITRYVDDINKQLDTTFRRSLTKALYEGEPMNKLALDFNKLKLTSSFDEFINEFTDYVRSTIVKPPTFEGHRYTDLTKYIKHNKQSDMLNKITKISDRVQKDLGAEIYIKPDNVKDIQKAQKAITNVFKGDIEDYLYTNNIETYGDALQDAVDNFLNTNLDDARAYFDNYNDLTRLLYKIKDSTSDVANLNDIDKILDELAKVNPFKIEEAKVTVQQGAVIRTLQQEKTYANLDLMNIESFNEHIINAIYRNEGLGAFINTMANADLVDTDPLFQAHQAALSIVQSAEHYRNYKRLLDRIVNTNIHDDLKNRFLSTIQKYAHYNPMNIYNNFDWFFDNVIKDAENFEYSVKMKRSLKLDEMRKNKEINSILTNLLKENPKASKAHQALYDVYTLQAVMQQEGLIEKYCTDPTKTYILFDIETMSLQAKQGTVFEIAYKTLGDKGEQLNLKLNPKDITHQPTQSLLRTFGEDSLESFYKNRSGDITSEKAMLQNFIDMVKSYKGRAVLIGHNSDRFDVDYLIKRMKMNGISNYDIKIFEDTTKLDTLSLLKKKDGYEVFQPDELFRLKKLLKDYTDNQLKAGIPKFISPNNGGMASALNEMRQCIRNILNSKVTDTALKVDFTFDQMRTMSAEFGDIAGEIFNAMRNIKRINNQLSHHFLMPELFDNVQGLFKNLPKDLQAYNPSQLLYKATSDLVNVYGYKNAIDFDKIIDWTIYKDGDEITTKLGTSLTSLAKQLEKTKKGINNIDFLVGKQKNLKEILSILLPKVEYSGKLKDVLNMPIYLGRLGQNDFYSHLKVDYTDTLSSFVMAQYIYNVYKNKGMLTPTIEKLLGKANIEFLDNSSQAFKNAFFHKGIDIAELKIDSDVARPEDIQRLIDDFNNNIINPLEELSKHDIFRARTHAMSMSLKPTQDMLNVYKNTFKSLDLEDRVKLLDNLKSYTDNLGVQQLNQVLKLDPHSLYKYTVHNAPWIEFSLSDIQSNKSLENAFSNLIANTKAFKELGIEIITDDYGKIYIVNTDLKHIKFEFDKNTKTLRAFKHGVEIPATMLDELDLNNAKVYLKDYSELADSVEGTRNSIHNLTENRSIGTLCEVLDVEAFRRLYSQLPDKVRKLLPDLKTLSNKDLFTNIRFNGIDLGTASSRRLKNPYVSNTIINTYKHHAELAALETKLKINYTNLYYGQEFGINNSLFFKDASNDEAIIKAFKNNPEYVLSALVKDKKFGHKAVILDATNPKALAEARRLNAVVLPRKVLAKVMDTVNGDLMNSYRKHWWNKLLYVYKVGYLLDPSVWFRNIIDSSLKTMVTTNAPGETLIANKEAIKDITLYNKIINNVINLDQYDLAKVKLYGLEEAVDKAIRREKAYEVLTASVLVRKYDDIIDDVIRLSPQEVGYKKFTRENLDFYFDNMHPQLSRETFDFIDAFIKDGPSAGLTSAWTKYYGADTSSLWYTFTNISGKVLSPNNKIEQINRLAEYLLLTKYGDNQNKAFYKVMKTHFDYADKAPYEIYTELIFPFYSFTMKNLEYWIDVAENNPAAIRQLENIMTPITNFDGYDREELLGNKSLQYQITSGNIPLTDDGLTLKTSPSFMDSFNLLFDPLASIKGKMFGPLQNIISIAVRNTNYEALKNSLNVTDYTDYHFANNYKDLSGYKDIPYVGGAVKNTLQTLQDGIKSVTDKVDLTKLGVTDIDEKNLIYDLLPILGTLMRKVLEQGPTYYERTNNLLNLVVPGLFGATNHTKKKPQRRFEIYPKVPNNFKWIDYPEWDYSKYGGRYYRNGYRRNYYNYRAKASNNYHKHYYNKWVYPNSDVDVGFYDKHYTKSGESRLKHLMRPNNGYTLKYKIKNTQIYYSSK